MIVLLGHLDWGLGTKDPSIDPADKTFLGLCIVRNVSEWSKLVKNGVKTCHWLLYYNNNLFNRITSWMGLKLTTFTLRYRHLNLKVFLV